MRGTMLMAFLMVFLLAGPAMANGYGHPSKAVDLGIKGGINMASLVLDPEDDDFESFLRFGGGVTLGFNVTPTFGIDLDVLYMMKGAKAEYTEESEIEQQEVLCDIEEEYKLDYLVFKPMMRLTLAPTGASPYILAGGEIGYLLSAKNGWEVACQGGQQGDDEEDIKEMIKDLDFGLNFGAGIELPMGTTSLIIEGHYSLGLSDILDSDEDAEDLDLPTIKTRGIYGFVGLRF
jgi:hypothetical protein